MNDSGASSPDESRDTAIDDIVANYIATLNIGSPSSLDAVCQDHAHLMPELAVALRTAAQIRAARIAAAQDPMNSLSNLSDANALDDQGDEPWIVGDYEIEEYLGGGSFGKVYRARNVTSGATVAIKILHATQNLEVVNRFHREADIGRKLTHPNIVPVFDASEWQQRPFIVMEWIDGPDLRSYTGGKPLPPPDAVAIMREVALACHYAHCNDIIHRDIKPGNILVSASDNTARMVDFGLAHDITAQQLTGSLQALGTLRYMAPEQADRRLGKISPATDIYSLGTTLYFLLKGKTPFPRNESTDGKSLVNEIVWDSPPPLAADIPKNLRTICYKCLQKVPADRYSSAAKFAADLDRFLAGKPLATRLPGPIRRSLRFCQRRPPLAAALAGLIITAFLGLWISATYANRARESADNAAVQRNQATKAQELEALHDYAADLQAVRQHWNAGKITRVNELLSRYDTLRTGGRDLRGFEWHYWKHLASNNSIRALTNSEACRSLAVDGSGKYLAAAGFHQVTIWSLETGQREQQWALPNERTRFMPHELNEPSDHSVAFSRDGKLVAATGYTLRPDRIGCLKVWELASGKEVFAINADPDLSGRAITFSPDGTEILAGGFEFTWKRWQFSDKKKVRNRSPSKEKPKQHYSDPTRPGPVTVRPDDAVTFLRIDGPYLFATTQSGGTAFKWPTGEQILDGQAQSLFGAGIPGGVIHFPGTRSLISASIDRQNTLQLSAGAPNVARNRIGLSNSSRSHRPTVNVAPPDHVYCTDLNGSSLAAGGFDNIVYRWALDRQFSNLSGPQAYRGHTDNITTIKLLTDDRIISADASGTIRLWPNTDPELVTVRQKAPSLCASLLLPRKAIVITDGGGEEFGEVEVQRSEFLLASAPSSTGRYLGLLISPSGPESNARFVVWDALARHSVASGSMRRRFLTANKIAFSSDDKFVAAISDHESVDVWSSDSERLIRRLPCSASRCVVFSPRADLLAVGGEDVLTNQATTITVWDIHAATRLQDIQVELPLRLSRTPFQFSSDGQHLVVDGNPTTMWDIRSGKRLSVDATAADAPLNSDSRTRFYSILGNKVEIYCPVTLRHLLSINIENMPNGDASEMLVPGTDGLIASTEWDRRLAELVAQWKDNSR